jgi:hypothetical protein
VSAFSHPRRAIVQKSAALLVTNATLNLPAGPAPGEHAAMQQQIDTTRHAIAMEKNLITLLLQISDKI